MKIKLTGTFTDTYEIEPEYYQADTDHGRLLEDVQHYRDNPQFFADDDRFDLLVTAELVPDGE